MSREASESPSIDTARNRLDDLLQSIRHQSSLPNGGKKMHREPRDTDEDEEDLEESGNESDESENKDHVASQIDQRRSSAASGGKSAFTSKFSPTKSVAESVSSVMSPASKKRRHAHQKKIVFELRQKAFEIQNSSIEHGLYALCRIWMRGKDRKDSHVCGVPIDRNDPDVKGAKKEVARPATRPKNLRGRIGVTDDGIKVTGDEEKPSEILDQFLPRWRQQKKDYCRERRQSDVETYGDSLRVLREMHAAAQQAQMR